MEFRAGTGAVWVLRMVLLAAVLLAAAVLWLPSIFWTVWPMTCAVLPFLAVPLGWWYDERLARSLYGTATKTAVRARYGVLWRREIFVPVSALRTFEVWTPPLHRLFRCRTVVLRFAGGAAWLPLLDKEDADRLTAWLEKGEEVP